MIKINPSRVASIAPERSSSDIQWQDFKVYFAVSVDQPHYQHLIHYGQDGPEDYYVWLAFGKMTGLHEGLTTAIDSMYEKEKLNVYGCNTLKEALEYARAEERHASEAETISLLYCALTVAEHDQGPDSLDFGLCNSVLASFYSRHGNPSAAYDALKTSESIYKKHLPKDHPAMQNCENGLKIVREKMEAQNA